MKQQLEDLMAEIKRTANRVRGKLKGKIRLLRSYCGAQCLLLENSHGAEHRTTRADFDDERRLSDSQNATLDAFAEVRGSDDGLQQDTDRLP